MNPNRFAYSTSKPFFLLFWVSDQIVDPTIDNIRITKFQALIYPQLLLEEIPLTMRAKATVTNSRIEASNIVQGKDDRLIVIVGPCSIHDPAAASEYGELLINGENAVLPETWGVTGNMGRYRENGALPGTWGVTGKMGRG